MRITSLLFASEMPQQNGVAERRNKTLIEMVKPMMSYSNLPDSFWGYALETATYILNWFNLSHYLIHPQNCELGANIV